MDPTINLKIGLMTLEASASGWLGVVAVTVLAALVVLAWQRGRHRVPRDESAEALPPREPQRVSRRPPHPEAPPSPPKDNARQ